MKHKQVNHKQALKISAYVATFVIGNLTADIYRFGQEADTMLMQRLSEVLYYVLPNLDAFNFRAAAVHGLEVPTGQYTYSLAYGIIYTIVILGLSTIVFRKRDFK